jgi:hypothetical protein
MIKYVLNLLIALDQLANAILLGSPDETLSSRAYRAWLLDRFFGKVFKPLIDILFFFDQDHCYRAYMAEVRKKQLPKVFSEI